MMKKEIFKVGEHTDSKGIKRIWTAVDLDKIVANFNSQKSKGVDIPAVIGHPEKTAPAYGWVSTVSRSGDSLYAEFEKVDTQFLEMVKQGKFKNTSISLDADLNLRHIGFLGAQAPAIPGLKDAEFEDNINTTIIEFAEAQQQGGTPEPQPKQEKLVEINTLIKEVRQELSPEVASKIESILKKIIGNNFTSKEDDEMNKRIEFLEKQNRDLQFENYFKDNVQKGKLIPAQRDSFRIVYDSVVNNGSMDFAKQNESIKAMDSLLESFPKHSLIQEFASANDSIDMNKENELNNIAKNLWGGQ